MLSKVINSDKKLLYSKVILGARNKMRATWKIINKEKEILNQKGGFHLSYEGVSKSPRTMLITLKPLVVHEFPARVCCVGVL